MRRWFLILLTALLLTGCTQSEETPSEAVPMQVPELLVAFGNRVAFLDAVTVDDGYFIYDFGYCVGEEFQYCVYELRCPENLPETIGPYAPYIYWEVVVLQEHEVLTVLRETADKFSFPPSIFTLVEEGDANFDGQTDILFWQGAFGAQAGSFHTCYLQENGTFIYAPSFSDLPNPILDRENRVILGTWRNHAASHSYYLSYYIDGEFVTKEELISGAYNWNDQDKYGTTVLEKVGDQWVERQHIPKEMEFAPLPEEFTTEGSHWALFTDRWSNWDSIRRARPVGGSIRTPPDALHTK